MHKVKYPITVLVVLMITALSASFVVAGDKKVEVKVGETVEATGWISDEWCGKSNANAEGKECAIRCAKDGAKLVLFSGDKAYTLADQKLAMKHVGIEVVVKGKVDENGLLQVKEIKPKKT